MALLVTSTAVVLLVAVLQVISGCDSGFMQLDVLRKRAEKVSGGSGASSWLNNELRLIPDWSFSCSGTITSFLLGVDVRTIKNNRNEYPVVQLWRKTNDNAEEYTKINSEEIRLDAGNFTANGVMQYHLSNSTGWQYQSGDILGIYHPTHAHCVVRIFYKNGDTTAPDTRRLKSRPDTTNTVDLDNTNALTTRSGELLLITPVSENQCLDNFLSQQVLQQKILEVNIPNVLRRDQEQRVFPSIHFTCSGLLTKWIVGGKVGKSVGAEVQIWRRNAGSENDYTKVGYTVLDATDPENDNVYEHIPNSPLEFQEGDILGVYQQSGGNRMSIYYQETTGPENYRLPGNINTQPPVSDSLVGATLVTDEYDYPLVTVETINTATTSVFLSSTPLLTMLPSTSNLIISSTITTLQDDSFTSQVSVPVSATSITPVHDLVTTEKVETSTKFATESTSVTTSVEHTTNFLLVASTPAVDVTSPVPTTSTSVALLETTVLQDYTSSIAVSTSPIPQATTESTTSVEHITNFLLVRSTPAVDLASPVPTTSTVALLKTTTVLKDYTSSIAVAVSTSPIPQATTESATSAEHTMDFLLVTSAPVDVTSPISTTTVALLETTTVLKDYTSSIAVAVSTSPVPQVISRSSSSNSIQKIITTSTKIMIESTSIESSALEIVSTFSESSLVITSVPLTNTNSVVTSTPVPHTTVILIPAPTTSTEFTEATAAVNSHGISQPFLTSTAPVKTSVILPQSYTTAVFESTVNEVTSSMTFTQSSSIANQNPIITSSEILRSTTAYENILTTTHSVILIPSTTTRNAAIYITQLAPTSSSVFMENPSVLQQKPFTLTADVTATSAATKSTLQSTQDTSRTSQSMTITSTNTFLEASQPNRNDSTISNQPVETGAARITNVAVSSPIFVVTQLIDGAAMTTSVIRELKHSTQKPESFTSTPSQRGTAEPVIGSLLVTRIVVGTPDIVQGSATINKPINILVIFGGGIGIVTVLVLITLCIYGIVTMATRRVKKSRAFVKHHKPTEKMVIFQNPLYCDPQTVEDSLKRGVTNPAYLYQEFNSSQDIESSFGVANPTFELDDYEKD